MMAVEPLILLLLEAATDGKDSSINGINGTPSETPSVVNGVGNTMVILPLSLDDWMIIWSCMEGEIRKTIIEAQR